MWFVVCGGWPVVALLCLDGESSSELFCPCCQSKAGQIDPFKSSQVTGMYQCECKTLVLVAATVPGLALLCSVLMLISITRV